MTDHEKAAAEVRARIEDWAAALRAKDADGIMASHAPDVLAFDRHSQLQFNDADAYRRHLEACMPHIQGPMVLELPEHRCAGGRGVLPLSRALRRTAADGKEQRCWLRGTTCLRRTCGTWSIVHAHCSAPFGPLSGRAMLDLAPQCVEQASAA
jgi:ketosteroid isomerase-like protein